MRVSTPPSLGTSTPPASPPAIDATHETAWRGIESALIAAQLSEIAPDEACDRMCAALKTHLGIRCVLLDGHQMRSSSEDSPSHPASVRLLLGSVIDGNAATLVLTKDRDPNAPHDEASSPAALGFTRQELERLKGVFLLLLQIAYPIPRSVETLHHLRNRLAGLQANLELLEMILPRATAGSDAPKQDDEITSALDHALQVCREMATTIRGLSVTGASSTP